MEENDNWIYQNFQALIIFGSLLKGNENRSELLINIEQEEGCQMVTKEKDKRSIECEYEGITRKERRMTEEFLVLMLIEFPSDLDSV
uniref:Putative ovule protein n=1 Tax=Solanum chacoense TaxID=4108 RepID=A0A0V0HHP5_SOLCH